MAQRAHMRDRGVEHVHVFVLPFGGEIAPEPSAAVDDVAPPGGVEGGEPQTRLSASRTFHSSVQEVERVPAAACSRRG